MLAVFLGGAVLAPWLYEAVQVAAGFFPRLQGLAAKPFPRYVNRSLLILALACLPSLLASTDLRSWRALGLAKRSDAASQFGWGFIGGLLSLATVVFVGLAAEVRMPAHMERPAAVLAHFGGAAATALLVAFLEEVLFRGVVFGGLRRQIPWPVALLVSSGIYALVHFLERSQPPPAVEWSSGLAVLANMVAGFADWHKLVPGFFNLCLAGMVLGMAYQRSGSLYLSMGLHAGWIFWLKSYGFMTDPGVDRYVGFFGTAKLVDGWLAFIVLAAVFIAVSMMSAHKEIEVQGVPVHDPASLTPPVIPPVLPVPPVAGATE
jgi:membrane protease YdiL (CAAX protease family)